MARPLLQEVADAPASAGIITSLAVVWLFIRSRNLSYADVGLSYERCVQQRQLFRVVSSQYSHIEILHLLFNVSSTWSLRTAESQGTLQYLSISLLLMVFSGGVYLGILHLCILYLRMDRYRHVTVVGYSCVVFGWMAFLSARGVAKFSVLNMASVPMALVPFASLVLTSVIFPRASFLGHLSGILCGYLVATGMFDWLTPGWLLSLAAWGAAWEAWLRLQSGELVLPGVVLQPPPTQADEETGSRSHLDALLV